MGVSPFTEQVLAGRLKFVQFVENFTTVEIS
jgi:hypothetical protein